MKCKKGDPKKICVKRMLKGASLAVWNEGKHIQHNAKFMGIALSVATTKTHQQ